MVNSSRTDPRTANQRTTNQRRSDAARGQSSDPGAFIGRLPEREAETIPGGLGRKDRRISAVDTQPGPARGPAPATAEESRPPEGHREATLNRDDARREAGQDR
jgi:hypothetical protein